jgi:hypothetical protein
VCDAERQRGAGEPIKKKNIRGCNNNNNTQITALRTSPPKKGAHNTIGEKGRNEKENNVRCTMGKAEGRSS